MELSEAKARVNLLAPAVLEKLQNADKEVTLNMTVNQPMITGAIMAATGYTRVVLANAKLTEDELNNLHTNAAREGRLWLIAQLSKLPEDLVVAWYMVEVDRLAGEAVEKAKEEDAGLDGPVVPTNTAMLDRATIDMANIKMPDLTQLTTGSIK